MIKGNMKYRSHKVKRKTEFPIKFAEAVFWCFHGVEKGYIRNKWVKLLFLLFLFFIFCYRMWNTKN